MNDIPPIKASVSPVGMRPPIKPEEPGGGEARPSQNSVPTDRVDISEMGQLLSTMDVEIGTDFRIDKVMEIRESIANGTYVTDAKINYTVSRLMEELRAMEGT